MGLGASAGSSGLTRSASVWRTKLLVLMKSRFNLVFAVLFTLLPLLLVGCGGGGGGGSSGGGGGGGGGSTRTPTPTRTPTGVPGVAVVVQLRDPSGAPVDGVVTVGGTVRATTNGDVSITFPTTGAQTVSVEVNGVVTTQTVNVVGAGTTVTITINPGVTPTPSGTIPPPPF